MKLLSHRSHKELDCSQEEWDKAMSFFNGQTRGYLANQAAHHYIIIELQEGEIISLHYFEEDDDQNARAVCEHAWRNDGDTGTTYRTVNPEYRQTLINFVNEQIK